MVLSFDHTKGEFWGGSQLSLTHVKIASVLGGFFGLDHVLLRSPITAILKTIVNFLTFGFWYFYDIIQLFGDEEAVKKYGYTLPFLGPVGLGTGIFEGGGKDPAPPTSPSPFYFLAYSLFILVPFGLSHFIAGDFYGGTAKFFMTFNPFTFLIAFIWAAYSAYYLTAKTSELLKKGTDRFFPSTLLMDPIGRAENIMQYSPPPPPPPSVVETVVGTALAPITATIPPLLTPFKGVLDTFIAPYTDPLIGAVKAGTAAVETTTATIKGVGDSVTTGILEPAKQVATAAAAASTAAAKVATEVPAIIEKVGATTTAFTDPAKLAELAAKQAGGGADNTSQMLFLGLAAFLCVGSVILTVSRFNLLKTTQSPTKDDVPPARSDDPPSGSRVL
jgi:hypothetical protein